MYELMIIVFIIGYICITIEHQIKIDKAAIALITGILCWTIYVTGKNDIVTLETIQAYAEKEFLDSHLYVPKFSGNLARQSRLSKLPIWYKALFFLPAPPLTSPLNLPCSLVSTVIIKSDSPNFLVERTIPISFQPIVIKIPP